MSKDRLIEVLERWEPVIGLEVHTEITACDTKMFCGCPVAFGGEPNTRVCPVCLGLPGALPVPNAAAIEWTVLAGLATNCQIAPWSQFHRKQYFYPDMPKDYQISQYDSPFCERGWVDIEVDGGRVEQRRDLLEARESYRKVACGDDSASVPDQGYRTRVGITRIHLEEDTGKMVHVGGAEGRLGGATRSLADFNRAGTPLMELVTEPDLRTPEEARRFAQQLRLVWLALGVSDCNMEEGSMRVDANVSIRRRGDDGLGVKSEIKNMNSFKALHDALACEVVRQADEIEGGGRVVQETRHWDAGRRRTSALRSKEEAHDYRYFPEPDMVPFELGEEYVELVRERLPELPEQRRRRFMDMYGLPGGDASVLAGEAEMAGFFEEAVALAGTSSARAVANVCVNDLTAHLNAESTTTSGSRITPAMVAELVGLTESDVISGKQAKEVFAAMVDSGEAPGAIVELRGMRQMTDLSSIEEVVRAVVAANPDKVEQYRGGKTGLLGFFVGAVMRETGGQANPGIVNDVLERVLRGQHPSSGGR